MRILGSISAIVFLPILLGSVAHAQSFTVASGQTVTTTQTMTGPNDIGRVQAGGTIVVSVNGTRAIVADGPYASIINSGLVSTTAFASRAIRASGSHTRITNYGTVSTAGNGFSVAINTLGGNSVIENFGTISTAGSYADAMIASGGHDRLVNYGTIGTKGLYASAMVAGSDNSTITNDGMILSKGSDSYAVIAYGANSAITNNGDIIGDNVVAMWVEGNGSRVTNNGKISVTGPYATGLGIVASQVQLSNTGSISATGNNAVGVVVGAYSNPTITNTGSIIANGQNAVGIYSEGKDVVINSGTISAQGANSRAIDFQGANSVLTLLPGSSIQGVINYTPAAGGSGTLNIEGSAGTVLTFTGALPANINANGLILGVDQSALKVVTADVSAARVTGVEIDTLLDSVYSSLNNRGNGNSRSVPLEPLGYSSATEAPAAFAFLDEARHLVQPRAWLNGFAGASQLQLTTGVKTSSHVGGFAAGIEAPLTQADTVGLLFGGAMSATSAGSTAVTANSGFAGLYSAHQFDQSTLDIALVLGGTRFKTERSVLDNMVPGGATRALADYNGFFVSPEIGLGHDFDLGDQTIKARAALQYAGLLLDGYSETGSAGGLTINPRSVQQLTAKTSIAVPVVLFSDANSATILTPRLGVDGSLQFGDQIVRGTLAGTPISFNANSHASVKVSVGAQFEHRASDKWSVIADIEGSMSSDNLLGARANLEFSLHF